jgi:ATP-binding protein involved in chromosome partitioning
MAAPTEAALREALRGVRDPRSGQDIVAAGLIDSLQTKGALVQLVLRADPGQQQAMERLRREAEQVLARQPGVSNAAVILTAHRPPPQPTHRPPSQAAPGHAAHPRPTLLPDVKHVVAVASGKGGVGKSTTAVNLAVSLARAGHRVGLLDADIYGPSLPRMLGISGKPPLEGGKMVPLEVWGLKAMSIGLLVDPDSAMIWRGPMVMSALEQMMGQVHWGALDIMIVDMPPGTGDAQLTMAQRVSLAGAVIVSTPQDIALIDARRGVRMFEKVMVPVLGLIENMSSFACPHCGEVSHLFGHGGARREADALGVAFLGEVPLLLDIRQTSDAGTPIAAAAPDSPAAQAYAAIAARVWDGLAPARKTGPAIIVDE